MERDNKIYEINYLMTPLIPEDKVAEDVAVLRKIIEDNKGFVVGEDQPKMQKLSYAIKKFDNAYYGWFKFSAGAESIDNIKTVLTEAKRFCETLLLKPGKKISPNLRPGMACLSRQERRSGKAEGASSETAEKVEIKPEQIDQKIGRKY